MMRCVSLLLVCCWLAGSALGQALAPRGFAPDGTVFAMKRKGNVLYVGGGFNRVGVHTGGSAFLDHEGLMPDVSRAYVFGEVYASIPDGQGGRFMGGDFSKVNGTLVSNIVHILPDETVDPAFAPDVDGSVEALALINDTLFFGGNFQNVAGSARPYLAAWNMSSASLSSWDPQPNGRIYTMKRVGNNLYVGGAFTRMGTYDQPGFASLDVQTGESRYIPGPSGGGVLDMDAEQDILYTVGNFTGATGYFTGRGAEVVVGEDVPVYEFPAVNGTINQIIPDGNGGWFVGGSFLSVGDQSQRRLAHILPTYELDPNFTPDPGGTVHTIALINDTLFFGGTFTTVDGIARQRLAAYDITNNLLTPWDPGANGTVSCMSAHGDTLFIGGSFSYVDSLYVPRLGMVSRLSGDAFPLAAPISGSVLNLLVEGNTLYAGGSFNGAVGDPTGRVARLTAEDSLPPWPFAEFNGTVETIIPDGQGGWFVGGSFTQVDGQTQRRLAHILPNNTLDPNFDLDPNGTIDELRIFNDTMMIAGSFTQINGQPRNRLAMYDMGSGSLTSFDPDVNNRIYDIGIFNDTMMIVGQFTTVGGQSRERIAMLDKQTGNLLPFSMPVNSTVWSLAWNDTMMFIGGQFSQVNGQTRNRIARISRGSGVLSSVATNINTTVRDLEIEGDILYIAGAFTSIDGQSRNRLAAMDLTNQTLTPWNPDVNNQVYTMSIFNDTMMIGGTFLQVGGQAQERVAKINRTTGALFSFNPRPNNAVNTIAFDGDKVLLGGSFSTTRYQNRQRLFGLDLGLLQPDGFNPQLNGTVEDFHIFNDTMMLAGAFTQVNGQPRQRVATVHTSTNQLGPLSLDVDNTVYTVSIFNDTMMLGGRFDQINGQDQPNLAAVSISSQSLIPWQPEPSNDVYTIAQSGNRWVVGGSFTTFITRIRNRAMALDMVEDSCFLWNPDVGGFIAPTVNCLHIDNSLIYLGGRFTGLGDSSATNLGAVDKQLGLATGQSIPIGDEVWDVTTKGDSILFVGEFQDVDAVLRRYAAGINKQTWVLNNWAPELEDDGFLIDNTGQELLMGGKFFMTNTAPRGNGYAINLITNELLPWNPDPNNIITDIEFSPAGDKVYVSGGFSEISSEPAAYFAALDPVVGTLLPGWDLDVSNPVRAIEVDPNSGDIYLGGIFSSIAGQNRSRLAAVDEDGTLLPLSLDVDDEVRSMAWRDNMLYLSGSFENINGIPRNKIAAISANGTLMDWEPEHDTPFFTSMGDLATSNDKVFIQGSFGEINGKVRNRIAAVGPVKGVLDPWNPRLSRGTGSFSINEIYPVGNDVFVAGTFTSARGTPVNGLARFDIQTGVIQPPVLSFPFASLTSFESFEGRLYFAGDYDSVQNTYQPNLASIQFEPTKFTPSVSSVTPQQGGNTGDVTLRIYGFGFTPGSRVILRKPGFDDIFSLDSGLVVTAGREIQAAFILRGEPVGLRDVYVEVPGDTTYFLPDAFEIVQGEEPDVWVDLVGPKQIRRRMPARWIINYGNRSNIDAVGVPVWMVLPRSFTIQAYSLKIARPRDTSVVNYTEIPAFYDIDSIGNQAFEGRLYVFTIPKIPANSSGQFSFRFEPQQVGPYQYKIWISKPMFGSPLKRLAGECVDEILVDLFGLVPGLGCAIGVMEATLCPMLDYADPESGFGSGDYVMDWGAGLAETVVTCALDASLVGGVIADIIKIILTAKNNEEIIEKCTDPYGEEEDDEGEGEITAAVDPNNKVGLNGEGGLGWITTEQEFPYLINFENVDTATAAAQIVTIYDTIDTQVFDLSTFQLGFFTLADSLYQIPPELKRYRTTIDLRPRLPMYVDFSAELDSLSGAVTWRFESIDTTTLEALNDPFLGLLPPNTDSISGMGSVYYTIRPFSGLPSGTSLQNKADIVFDFEDPIVTDPWVNTADNDIPESAVSALPDTLNTTLIPLRWTGSDLGSGIRYYNIYYSQDGEQYLTAAYQTSDTTMLFEAEPGSSYRFYSVAYDTARNREPLPIMHDAETYVQDGATQLPSLPGFQAKLFPNPSDGDVQLTLSSGRASAYSLHISNSLGQVVHQAQFQLPAGESTRELNLTLPAGIYYVLIQDGEARISQKLEIR